MGSSAKIFLQGSALLISLVAIAACSTSQPIIKPEAKEVFVISQRQLPPEPVYNRITLVRPPEVLPPRDLPQGSASEIKPIFHLQVNNERLEEVSKSLATFGHYHSYCASSIASKRMTLNQLGTLDELAQAVEKAAGIKVVVDHENAAIRFLANLQAEPEFAMY